MKMKKKLVGVSVALMLVASLTLAGCGGKTAEDQFIFVHDS